MKRLIVGDTFCVASAFFGTVYESFLKTLVQFLYDLTLDMKEYLRLGRSLWPQYIVPVLPANVDATMKAVTSKASNKLQKTKSWIEREILSLLDQRIFPRIKRAMEHGLGLLALNSPFPIETSAAVDEKETRHSSQDMPQLAIYLFLAVYLCQANRPDRDKHLFSIQTNGKTKKGVNGSMEEDVAFGLGPQAASLRSRSFPAERLYSLYVSIISLHPFNDLAIENCNSPNKTLHSLGNVTFHEMVAYLKDVGVLHEYPKRSISDTIRVGQRSFWSSITFDEAQRAANTINFPLDRYTM